MNMITWFSFVLVSTLGYLWAMSALHRRLGARVSRRLSGNEKNFWKEFPLILGLNLCSEGSTEISHYSLRQLREGNITSRQFQLALAFNTLCVLPLAAVIYFGILNFNFSVLIVGAFAVWLWEKYFRSHTSIAFVLFGFGLWGLSFEQALRMGATLMNAGGSELQFLLNLGSRHWLDLAFVFVGSAVANAFIRKWPLFLISGLLLGWMALASQPMALTFFIGAWIGQLFMDAWDQRRSPSRKPYLFRVLLSLGTLLGGLVWFLFFGRQAASLFEAKTLFGELILGLGFILAVEIGLSSLFFHFYFARSAKSSS